MAELKPCPFCGDIAIGPERFNKTGRPIWMISCASWCIVMYRATKKEAIEAWNRREVL